MRSRSIEVASCSARSHCECACRAEQPERPKQDKHIPADPNSARSRKLAAKKAKAREVRNAKKLAAKARKQRAADRAQQAPGGRPTLCPTPPHVHPGMSVYWAASPVPPNALAAAKRPMQESALNVQHARDAPVVCEYLGTSPWHTPPQWDCYLVAGKAVPAKNARGSVAGRVEKKKPAPEEGRDASGQARPQAAAAAAGGMLAWQGLGLGQQVVAAVAALGFEEPTPIQRECMLPAVRDRRDIIGAAQTVRPPYLLCSEISQHANAEERICTPEVSTM